jgi:hypothetical protein
VAVYAGIASSIVSVISAVAHVPKPVPVVAIGVAGSLLAFYLWKKIPESRKIPVRSLAPFGAVAAAFIVIAFVVNWISWSSPQSATSSQISASIKTLGAHITPASHADIGACTQVTGSGAIPAGYRVWVANLNDMDGEPDMSEFFSFQPVHSGGPDEWETNPFSVGSAKPTDPNFWINVYLVPDSVDSVLSGVVLPKGWAVSLRGPIKGSYLIAEIPVVRDGSGTC